MMLTKLKCLKNKEKISKSNQKLSLKKLKESKEKVNVADAIYNYLIEIEKKTKRAKPKYSPFC